VKRWQTILFWAAMLALPVGISYGFAQLGEPQAVWLWSFIE
jgi:hypothetical protein